MTNKIELTKQAIKAIKKQSPSYLRIGIKGGSCAGFSYILQFEDKKDDKDLEFDFDGAKVIVDPKSIKFLNGSVIDYHNSLMKAGFKIENPNAESSCGCGKSFSIK